MLTASVCHICGQPHRPVVLQPGEKARCCRCNALLAERSRASGALAPAAAAAALILLVPAMILPFVGADELGDRRVCEVLTGVDGLWSAGLHFLAILVLLTGTVFPAVLCVVLIWLHLPERFTRGRIGKPTLAGVAKILVNWSFPEVQVLAVIVGAIKLGSLVDLAFDSGFWCYVAMAGCVLLARRGFSFHVAPAAPVPAAALGETEGGRARFLALGSSSRATCAALAAAAVFLLFPANYFPVLSTATAGYNRTDTIFSGAMELGQSGMWGLAAIVFTASILIPALKLAGLTFLLLGTRRPSAARGRKLTRVYAALDFIGRWSMLDVFLGAFMVGLVQFGQFATIAVRSGMIAFGAVVVLTVAATAAFNPSDVWPRRSTADTEFSA